MLTFYNLGCENRRLEDRERAEAYLKMAGDIARELKDGQMEAKVKMALAELD
jgi:hypothetical protein